MTHEDAGHYAAKHPAGTEPDPKVAASLRARAENERISCAVAFAVAADLGVTASELGRALDLLEYRITHCQLGLFGYSPEKKIVTAAAEVSDELSSRLRDAVSEGRIACAACWRIAEALGLGKMATSAACECLGLKIGPCQLGAF